MYRALRKIVLAAIFALSISGNSKAQTYVLIPDANFRTYLQGLIPSAMSGNSLNITSTLVTTSTQSLTVGSMSISNLSGAEYFTSLTYLSCYNNSITSLPTLPNSLTYLICNSNSLTSLPALPSSLFLLNCAHNPLISLPVLPNSITRLLCEADYLTSLPNLPNSLVDLQCPYNFLTSLPAFPNTLRYLSCAANSLTTLPDLPNSLTDLDCGNNKISCFPIFPSSITYVGIYPNPFNCLPNKVLPAMNGFSAIPLCQTGNSNGCAVIGIKELNPIIEFISVYPNPSSGSFKFKIDNEIINGELVILNSLGQRVHEQKIVKGENYITIDKVSIGLYQYVILQNKQQLSRGKLIIE